MKTRKYHTRKYKGVKKKTRKQKNNSKKHLKNKTIKVIKYKSLRKYKKQPKKIKRKTNNRTKKGKNKRGGMSWPAGIAIGVLTLAGLGLGATAIEGVKQANLVMKGKADDKRERENIPRKYTYSNIPQQNPSQMSVKYEPEDDGDNDTDDYAINPSLYGESPETTRVRKVEPQELSKTIPVRQEKQLKPFKEIRGSNFGKPDESVNMGKIHSQKQNLKLIPELTPYPPPPKVTPLQEDNDPIIK